MRFKAPLAISKKKVTERRAPATGAVAFGGISEKRRLMTVISMISSKPFRGFKVC